MARSKLTYTIIFARSARKELECLDQTIALRVLEKIEALPLDPRPTGCKKLSGQNSLWRIRVGNSRVVYAINDKDRLIDITIIRHRNNVYKDLD